MSDNNNSVEVHPAVYENYEIGDIIKVTNPDQTPDQGIFAIVYDVADETNIGASNSAKIYRYFYSINNSPNGDRLRDTMYARQQPNGNIIYTKDHELVKKWNDITIEPEYTYLVNYYRSHLKESRINSFDSSDSSDSDEETSELFDYNPSNRQLSSGKVGGKKTRKRIKKSKVRRNKKSKRHYNKKSKRHYNKKSKRR